MHTMTDAFGREFTTAEIEPPHSVAVPVGDGTFAFVPYVIASRYPEGTTLAEIEADLRDEED